MYVTISDQKECRICQSVLMPGARAFNKDLFFACVICCRKIADDKKKASRAPIPEKKRLARQENISKMSEKKRLWYTTGHNFNPLAQATGDLLKLLQDSPDGLF